MPTIFPSTCDERIPFARPEGEPTPRAVHPSAPSHLHFLLHRRSPTPPAASFSTESFDLSALLLVNAKLLNAFKYSLLDVIDLNPSYICGTLSAQLEKSGQDVACRKHEQRLVPEGSPTGASWHLHISWSYQHSTPGASRALLCGVLPFMLPNSRASFMACIRNHCLLPIRCFLTPANYHSIVSPSSSLQSRLSTSC